MVGRRSLRDLVPPYDRTGVDNDGYGLRCQANGEVFASASTSDAGGRLDGYAVGPAVVEPSEII